MNLLFILKSQIHLSKSYKNISMSKYTWNNLNIIHTTALDSFHIGNHLHSKNKVKISLNVF